MADPYAAFSSVVENQADPYASFSSPVDNAPAQQPAPTILQRAQALGAGINSGAAHILGTPIDALANIRDLAKAGAGSIYAVFAGKDGKIIPTRGVRMFDVGDNGQLIPSQTQPSVEIPQALQITDRSKDIGSGDFIQAQLSKVAPGAFDVPRPDDPVSRYLFAGGSGLSAAALGPAAGAKVIPSAISGVTGAEAQQAAAENGAGNTAQVLAGLAGGIAPSAARVALAESARRLARGGEAGRQQVAQNIQDFRNAGTTPSVGQATESRIPRATESLLSRVPGSAGQMASSAENQGEQIGTRIGAIADSLSPNASGEQAGRAIQRGIGGDGGFVSQFKAKQEQLYNALDKHIQQNTRVDVTNTAQALKALNADIPGAPNVSEFFKNAKIKGIEGALKADTEGVSALKARTDIPEFSGDKAANTPKADMDLAASLLNDGKLPYEAVKKLRTLVGNELADSGPFSDVPRSKWKPLYAALSSDMEAAATSAGPDATAAFNRANNYTRAGMKRLDVIDSVVDKAGGPEAVFKAATSGAKEGATTLRAVMQSLPEDAQKTLSAGVLRRLGRAKAGVQNDVGDQFSTETFLTNWNSLSPQAKAVLFDRYGEGFRQNMDSIAKVASNLRDGSKVFKNPSGTGAAITQTGGIIGLMSAIASGNVKTAIGMAAGMGGANVAARALTNPKVVGWLAKTTKASKSALPALINQAQQSNDPDLRDLGTLLQQQISNQGQ